MGKKNKHFKFGVGLRLTSAFGAPKGKYITAPAKLTSGKTGPSVFFSEQIHPNIDTFEAFDVTSNFILNAYLALAYDLNKKWGAEFNIDLAGVSAGPPVSGTIFYKEEPPKSPLAVDKTTQSSSAAPTIGNLLLISDNDIGSLNSEFIISYKVSPKYKMKAGISFLFNEYKVRTPVAYTNSIGTFVNTDRYRKKSLMFAIGASLLINKKSHVEKNNSPS